MNNLQKTDLYKQKPNYNEEDAVAVKQFFDILENHRYDINVRNLNDVVNAIMCPAELKYLREVLAGKTCTVIAKNFGIDLSSASRTINKAFKKVLCIIDINAPVIIGVIHNIEANEI